MSKHKGLSIILSLALSGIDFAPFTQSHRATARGANAIRREEQLAKVDDEQSAPVGFREVLGDNIKWVPNPTVPGSQAAILLGDPLSAGPLVVRVRFSKPVEIMPHTHPEARTYTVLRGVWKLGFGERYNAANLRSYPAGSVYRLPAGIPHFQASGPGETIVQIESIGPSGTTFLHPGDRGSPERLVGAYESQLQRAPRYRSPLRDRTTYLLGCAEEFAIQSRCSRLFLCTTPFLFARNKPVRNLQLLS